MGRWLRQAVGREETGAASGLPFSERQRASAREFFDAPTFSGNGFGDVPARREKYENRGWGTGSKNCLRRQGFFGLGFENFRERIRR